MHRVAQDGRRRGKILSYGSLTTGRLREHRLQNVLYWTVSTAAWSIAVVYGLGKYKTSPAKFVLDK